MRAAALSCLEAFSSCLKAHDTKLQRDAAVAAAAAGNSSAAAAAGAGAGSGGVAPTSSGMLGWAMSGLASSAALIAKGTGSPTAAAAAAARGAGVTAAPAAVARAGGLVSSSGSSNVGPVTPAAGGGSGSGGLGAGAVGGGGAGDGWDDDFEDMEDAAEAEVSLKGWDRVVGELVSDRESEEQGRQGSVQTRGNAPASAALQTGFEC